MPKMSLLLNLLVLIMMVCGNDARLVMTLGRYSVMDVSGGKQSHKSALHARQLVHKNLWATMATISQQFHGIPFANVVSYADDSKGKLYFYLTQWDSTGMDLAANSSASIAISMAQDEVCKMDVEDPTCWKISLTGKVVQVAKDDLAQAKKILFARHPQMAYWPSDHGFHVYVFELENIVLLDFYGGAKHIPVDEYYAIKLDEDKQSSNDNDSATANY